MKSEVDFLRMTEEERICWLQANRLTLAVVGAVWIALIVRELLVGHSPWFLIAMVPVFALVRLAAYRYYKRSITT